MRNQRLKVLSNSTDAPPIVGTSYRRTLSSSIFTIAVGIFLMIGIFFIVIFTIWFFFSKTLSWHLTKNINIKEKIVIRYILFLLFLILPALDEIVGGFQFRSLCKHEAQIVYDKEKLIGRAVYSELSESKKIEYLVITIFSQTWFYRDIKTHESLMRYKTFDAEGGWLSRAINFQNLGKPFTFNGHCGPGWTKVDSILKSSSATITKKYKGEK